MLLQDCEAVHQFVKRFGGGHHLAIEPAKEISPV